MGNQGGNTYHYEDTWMDHPGTRDASFSNPDYCVSKRKFTKRDKSRPVILCAHGFTASTYEWEEFREYAENHSRILVSNVLLGGHGRSVFNFEKSTWLEWERPVLEEYRALAEQGYKNISCIGASTGAALILEALLTGKLADYPAPEKLIFVDPFIIPTTKTLALIEIIALFIKNFPFDGFSEEERGHYYVNRPAKSLVQLNRLARKVRKLVREGNKLPPQTRLRVYKARTDDAADPAGARFLGKYLREYDGNTPEIIMVDTDKHVFLRGKGRAGWDERDSQLQLDTFDEILQFIDA